jgi:uncharacterized membrane protein
MSAQAEKASWLSRLGHNFLTGLFLMLPLGLTLYVVSILVDLLGKPAKQIALIVINWVFESAKQPPPNLHEGMMGLALTLASALVMLIVLTIVGYLSKRLFGKFMHHAFAKMVEKTPGLGALYNSIRQMVDALSGRNKDTFRRVVLVQYPRPDCWSIAFVTHEQPAVFSEALGRPVVNVFIPAAPAPTSGFILQVPPEDIRETRLKVSEALGLLMSFGAVVPKPEDHA